ncbi:hypothetical protein [Sediminibacterium ginsengisoli]|uniref:Uncharacterized protein n=1 Tax=Sediminibacterium ginsengisoli TaxID=413434 RepID=A0A1T4NPH3_9BACT|nr:hypothetical protein [Sediminibacterium ginsengisoli]SJZ80946.1 hypothetical protein SAMN04488132_104340 [Sediminibacterium ginsengisoli]
MKKLFFSVCMLCAALSMNAQMQTSTPSNTSLLVEANGSPHKAKPRANVDGTPYYNDDYCSATLYGADGKPYAAIPARLNLQENLVIFKRGDAELTPSFMVKKIEFGQCDGKKSNAVFESGFPAIGVQNEGSFYQVLDDGKTKFLKYIQIVETATQNNGLNPSAATLTLQRNETFYVYSPAKGMVKVGKSADDLLNALADRRDQVASYISSNKFKLKKEDEMVKVINFYNTL